MEPEILRLFNYARKEAETSITINRLKESLRKTLREGRGRSVERVIEELNKKLRGWANYFKLAEVKLIFEELDSWIRRKILCILWRQWKRPYCRAKNLRNCGLSELQAWKSATNGRGPWWNSGAKHMNIALTKFHFDQIGLVSLYDKIVTNF